jgi:hypothetical protein
MEKWAFIRGSGGSRSPCRWGSVWAGGEARVSRAEFEANLVAKLSDREFRFDIVPLLASGVSHDVDKAAAWVTTELLSRLP